MWNKTLKDNRGVSLLELIVSFALFVLIVLIATGIFQTIVKNQKNSINQQIIQENMRYVFEVITREVRFAQKSEEECGISDGVYNTDGNEQLKFKNEEGQCVSYYLDSGSGRLMVERDNRSGFATPAAIKINNLSFLSDETSQPRVSIMFDVVPAGSVTGQRSQKLQTTISSRFYELPTYLLFFEANGGIVDPESITVAYGEVVGPLPVPVLEGNSFVEWNTEPDGTGEVYTHETTYEKRENFTVYAIWEEAFETRTALCSPKPENTKYNTVSQITQTLIGENWMPDNMSVFSDTETTDDCHFNCETTNYEWNEEERKCEPKTRQINCLGLPSDPDVVYNTVNEISQTWSGMDWLPDETTIYNTTATTTACHFTCKEQYQVWDASVEACMAVCGVYDDAEFDNSIFCDEGDTFEP